MWGCYGGNNIKIRLLLYTGRQESTKEPDEFDLWERDQATFSQIGDEFDSFIDDNPILLGERGITLSWWLKEVQRQTYPSLSSFHSSQLMISEYCDPVLEYSSTGPNNNQSIPIHPRDWIVGSLTTLHDRSKSKWSKAERLRFGYFNALHLE